MAADSEQKLHQCVEAADAVGWARATIDEIMLNYRPGTNLADATDYIIKELADSIDKLVNLTCLPAANHPALQGLARDLRSAGRHPADQFRLRDIATVDIPEAMEVP
ncbi:hypothetical protein LCGC14_0668730 [marine sediment metagenome]|uniref:Uncharacterized protein n=1 Tax=marine sediment metagenome TaxID=412755 RepID=A0A0F9TD16_9ZZZZ